MKKAVQRFLPTRSATAATFKKSLKFDNINLIQDFFIDLDEPHKTWRPGDSITGVVVLDLKRNVTEVNITLTLVGYIKIKQGPNTTNVRNKPTVLFRHTTTIYGFDPNDVGVAGDSDDNDDEPTSGLSRGEHRFPFSMRLPKRNIYTSISFEKGSISYSLRASINHKTSTSPPSSADNSPASQHSTSTVTQIAEIPRNSIQHCDKDLNIIVPINVAKIPKPQTKTACLRLSDRRLFKTISSTSTINSNATYSSMNSENSNESGTNVQTTPTTCKDQAIVKLSVDIPQSGFLRGELVPLKIKLSHYKAIQSSTGLIVTLIRLCRVDNGPESAIQSFRKDLCQTVVPLYIDPESLTGEVSTSLRVPADAFPTIVGSDIVTFQYYVEILANVNNKNIGSSYTSKKASQKFSHSIVFDLDQQPDQTTAEESMINVDALKRTKHFLGLNTEIIVGTERTFKKRSASDNKSQHAQEQLNNEPFQNSHPQVLDPAILEAVSQTSISPINIDGEVAAAAVTNSEPAPIARIGNEEGIIPEIPSNASEKEILRLREEALLPSEPTIYEDSAPSYIRSGESDFTAPSTAPEESEMVNDTSAGSTADKSELERRRLLVLESEPPEFDYVPEYPRARDVGEITATPTIAPALPPLQYHSSAEQGSLRG